MFDQLFQKWKVNSLNQQRRNAFEENSYSSSEFFSHSNPKANLFVHGADSETRALLLASFIKDAAYQGHDPIIILSQNRFTKQFIIELAERNEIGEMYPFSKDKEDNDYDFFSGMKKNNIVDFFRNMAENRGYADINSLDAYTNAFIEILYGIYGKINLSAMLKFLENTDTEIYNAAMDKGYVSAATILQSQVSSRSDFRTLLIQFKNAVADCTATDVENDLSISHAMGEPYIVYIDVSDINNTDIPAFYFMEVLNSISNQNYTVIFDDCSMLTNQKFQEGLQKIKHNDNSTVIISCSNIYSIFEEKNLSDFGRQVIFLRGQTPAKDTQALLSRLGNYDHLEILENVSKKSESFGLFDNDINNATTTYKKDKILYDENKGCTVLVGVDETEILMIKNFIIDME